MQRRGADAWINGKKEVVVQDAVYGGYRPRILKLRIDGGLRRGWKTRKAGFLPNIYLTFGQHEVGNGVWHSDFNDDTKYLDCVVEHRMGRKASPPKEPHQQETTSGSIDNLFAPYIWDEMATRINVQKSSVKNCWPSTTQSFRPKFSVDWGLKLPLVSIVY